MSPANSLADSLGEPESPCLSICTIDADGLCVGCLRTLSEIELWPDFSVAEKRRLLGELRSRQEPRARS